MITVTRRYYFSASHRLHSTALSASENTRVYGKCNNPFGHGHDYCLEVTVTGKVDLESGLVVPIGKLDCFVEDRILHLFAHRNINLDVPQFAHVIPTTENLTIVVASILEEHWGASFQGTGTRLVRIHIQETARNGFELLLGQPNQTPAPHHHAESETVHV